MNIMKQQETTLVQRACAKVAGFRALHKRLEKKDHRQRKKSEHTQQLHALYRAFVFVF